MRQHHSTETVLLKLFSDLQQAKDRGQVSVQCLLDLMVAFDMVDHELLLQRTFGINGSALVWFRCYLSDRMHCVVVDGMMSQVIHVLCSVPWVRCCSYCTQQTWPSSLQDLVSCYMPMLMTISCISSQL